MGETQNVGILSIIRFFLGLMGGAARWCSGQHCRLTARGLTVQFLVVVVLLCGVYMLVRVRNVILFFRFIPNSEYGNHVVFSFSV